MTEFSGGGDPARSIALLWGVATPTRRGPKPGLDVERVVRAAIELADAEGLAALSMRRVAERLGVGTMSLYTYVPAKAELIDLMLDRVLAEVIGGDDDGDWRERLALMARDSWDLYRRHPWMLQVATARPPLGPNVMAKYEQDLRAVDGIGLTDLEMDAVVTLVGGFVQGAARGAAEAAQVSARTGLTDAQWWEASAPVLEQVIDDGSRYPLAGRVGTAAGEAYGAASDPERAFAFGLERILDGLEVLLSRRG